MFTGNMVTEAIPTRVYALYKIVISKKNVTRSDLQKLMEPENIYEGNSYFSTILKAATELKIVDLQDNYVVPIASKDCLKTIEDFRRYVITKLSNFEESQFYKCTNTIVNMNERVFKYNSISDKAMLNYVSERIEQQITPPMIRGWRFWAQFLGFGYMYNMVFLPNAYIYTKNVVLLMDLIEKKEYRIDDFITTFNQFGRILTRNNQSSKNLNIAFSSALRELHDNGEIVLKYGSDQGSNWILYPSNEFFNDPIASIIYMGVKR